MAELVPTRLLRPRVFGVNLTSGKNDVPVCRTDTKHQIALPFGVATHVTTLPEILRQDVDAYRKPGACVSNQAQSVLVGNQTSDTCIHKVFARRLFMRNLKSNLKL